MLLCPLDGGQEPGLERPQTDLEPGGTVRQLYETSDIVEYTGTGTRRLQPPASLGERERAVFIDLVTGCDPRHFQPEQAAGELAATGVVVDGKLSPWFQA